MDIKVVIGANFGDEGKGLMTDYFAAQYEKCLVVRSNGGSQAGHTVKIIDGIRHVFKHFGSGSLAGADTYLSEDFILNPINFRTEREELIEKCGVGNPTVYVDSKCVIATPFDMLLNQAKEKNRGNERHGSCGNGIYETLCRNHNEKYRLSYGDLSGKSNIELKLIIKNIRDNYFMRQMEDHGLIGMDDILYIATNDNLIDHFVIDMKYMQRYTKILCQADFDRLGYDGIVFEGAQGLLLDCENKEYFPNLTPSFTGLKNPAKTIELFHMNSDQPIEVVYVTRTYMTRHGAGRFVSECQADQLSNSPIVDMTNQPNQYQGSLRFGFFDAGLIEKTIINDFEKYKIPGMKMSLAITHTNETNGNLMMPTGSIDVGKYEPFNGKIYRKYLSDGQTRVSVSCTEFIELHLTDQGKIDKWLSEHDGEDYCQYCTCDCEHPGVSGGPNGPIYPPCAERDITEFLDTDAILQDIMEA